MRVRPRQATRVTNAFVSTRKFGTPPLIETWFRLSGESLCGVGCYSRPVPRNSHGWFRYGVVSAVGKTKHPYPTALTPNASILVHRYHNVKAPRVQWSDPDVVVHVMVRISFVWRVVHVICRQNQTAVCFDFRRRLKPGLSLA